MQTTGLALLVMISGPLHASHDLSDPSIIRVQTTPTDSAHTLITPNAPDPGRAGQVYQLPQGGIGVTTGGTSHYQTLATPGGSAIAVPNGNNTSAIIGSNGRAGTATTPR